MTTAMGTTMTMARLNKIRLTLLKTVNELERSIVATKTWSQEKTRLGVEAKRGRIPCSVIQLQLAPT